MSNLLIVEDDIVQAQGLRFILEDAGHQITIASDGEQALLCLSQEEFDAVLSDVVMPGMSGYDLCKKIKAEFKHVPVILVTALSDLRDLINGLVCGADNFITKPYEPQELLNQLRKVIESNAEPGAPICDPNTGVCLIDNKFMMNMDRRRILDWLVSTFDEFLKARERHSEAKLEDKRRKIEERERRLSTTLNGIIRQLEVNEAIMNEVVSKQDLQLHELEKVQRACRETLECARREKDTALV